MFILLLACTQQPKVTELPENHLLFTSQGPYKDDGYPGVWETREDFSEVWSLDLPGEQGAFGAVRIGEDTLITRTEQPPDPNTALERVARDGTVVWAYNTDEAGLLVLPHGVGQTPWNQYLVADVFTFRIMAVGADGKVDWVEYTTEQHGAPSGLEVGMVDGKPMLLATLLDESPDTITTNDQVYAWWLKEDGLELAWKWPETIDASVASWLRGAHFQHDGSLLVNAAGLGNIVELDPRTGRELRRIPEDDRPLLVFPRDAVLLPDGDMIVVDAAELLRIRDPFGAFEIVDSAPAPLTYSVELINCEEEVCY